VVEKKVGIITYRMKRGEGNVKGNGDDEKI